LGTPTPKELVKVQREVGAAQARTEAEEDMAMDFQATVEELAVEEGMLKEKVASMEKLVRVGILETPPFA